MRIYAYLLGSKAKSVAPIDAQEAAVRTFCRTRWPEVVPTVCIDPARASKLPLAERGAGRALTVSLKRGDVLVLPSLDRGFRTLRECSIWLGECARRGIDIHIVDLAGKSVDLGTTSPEAPKVIEILEGFADFDRRMSSIRTSETVPDRKFRGERHCNYPGYGRKWAKVNGREIRVQDDEERAIMRRIVAWRNESPAKDFEEIYEILLKEGVTVRKGSRKPKPRPWSRNRIRRAYLAELELQKEEMGG